jgi:hypothetical protein
MKNLTFWMELNTPMKILAFCMGVFSPIQNAKFFMGWVRTF